MLMAWGEMLNAWESVLSAWEPPAWGNSAITLGVSTDYLGITKCLGGLRSTDCLGISTICL